MEKTATVVGAGIAGLAAATALQRRGWSVHLVERAPALRSAGAGLLLWPNALRALDALGLGDPVRRRGAVVTEAATLRPDGSTLTALPVDEITDRFGPLVVIHRADLHDALGAGFGGGVAFDVAAEARDGRVLLDSRPVTSELVLGADGIHSAVRQAVVGPVAPRPTNQLAWRGVAATGGSTPGRTSETWGRGALFGVVPLPRGRTYWFAALPACRRDVALEDVFAGWHEPIADLLAASPAGERSVLPLEDLPPLPTWHDGHRVVLVGDAAHAMTPNLGQGAAQALIDVATLVEELERRPVPEALVAYQARRKAHAERVVARSRAVGRLALASGRLTAPTRDLVARATPRRVVLRQVAALLEPQPG